MSHGRRPLGGGPAPAVTGPPTLGAGAIRDLARRHGIRPTKSLGQHFLIDPNLARAIAAEAGVRAGDRVVEVGARLTVALAATGADVLAIEFDRALVPALEEVVAGARSVRVVQADAMKLDWDVELVEGQWTLCANLPFNVAVPLVLDTLAGVPAIERWVVMVQREVGQRLVARAGDEHFGAPSLRVAYRASASIVRRVSSSVFWPRPAVDSVVVRLDRRLASCRRRRGSALARRRRGVLRTSEDGAQRARRLGLSTEAADAALAACGVESTARPEELDLATFAAVAERIVM